MGDQSIGLQDWFATPPGRYLLDWEHQQFSQAVADIFGYHALQLGLAPLDTLQANRMPHRWLALPEPPRPEGPTEAAPHSIGPEPRGGAVGALVTDFAALPFAANSLDLVTLPHALELGADPHATLAEVARVLVPEGRVVISGLNPVSLWGLRQRRGRIYQRLGWGEPYLPQMVDFIGYWRLRDWLRLLNFEVEMSHFGVYRPSVASERWLQRYEWMDRAGARWWPIFGAAYFLVAVKRVRGMRLLGATWKQAPSRVIAPVSVANYSVDMRAGVIKHMPSPATTSAPVSSITSAPLTLSGPVAPHEGKF
jgi:SAM-dependent methyltransferase